MRISPTGDLAARLATADPAVEIELEPGDYRLSTSLTLNTPLRLKGAGMFQTRLVGAAHGPLLVLAQGGRLEGLTVERTGTEFGAVVVVEGGRLELKACRFRGAASHEAERQAGLILRGRTEAELSECHFDHNQGHGLGVYDEAVCQAVRCQAKGNQNFGIHLAGRSRGRIESCECAENGSGVGLAGHCHFELFKNFCHHHQSGMGISCASEGDVVLRKNECSGNVSGIELRDQTRAQVDRNECSENSVSGITCFDQCAPLIKNNACRANGQGGIQVWEQARPRVERNFLFGNESVGISFHEGSTGVARGNQCVKNGMGMSINDLACPDLIGNECNGNGAGLTYFDQAGGSASANKLSENEGSGIQVGDSCSPRLLNNQCTANGHYGILFLQNASGEARGNQCWKNQKSDRVVIMDEAAPTLNGNLTHRAGEGFFDRIKGVFRKARIREEVAEVGPEPDDELARATELTDLPRYLQQMVVMKAPQELLEQARARAEDIQRRPEDPESYLAYAMVMDRLLQAEAQPREGWLEGAARALERALELKAQDEFGIRMRAGKARYELRESDCVAHFRAAVALRPESPEARLSLVQGLHRSGELAEAVAAGREGVARCPELAELHYELALVLERTGETSQAKHHYLESERLDPNDYRVQNDFGVTLYGLGEYEEALKRFRHGLALRPDDELAQKNLDRCLARLDELSTAVAHGRQASVSLLFCPACSLPMDALQVREVELDRCGACGGLWFDGGELKVVLKRMDAPGEVLEPPAQAPEKALRKPGQRPCCRCKELLKVTRFDHVEVDVCGLCGGFFLDRGELGELWGLRGRLLKD